MLYPPLNDSFFLHIFMSNSHCNAVLFHQYRCCICTCTKTTSKQGGYFPSFYQLLLLIFLVQTMFNIQLHQTLFETMHNRLRGSIWFLNVQKKSKSKRLFLTQGTPKTDNFAFFVKIMTQILCKIIFSLC